MSEPVNIRPYEDVLSVVDPDFHPLDQANRTLDQPAFYDFSFYEQLFPTELGGYRGSLSERALATLDDLQATVGADLAALLLDILVHVERTVRANVRILKRGDWDEQQVVLDLLDDFYRLRAAVLPDMLQAYQAEIWAGIGRHFLEDFLDREIASYLRGRIYQAWPSFYGFWSAWPGHFSQAYGWWHTEVNRDPTQGLPDWTGDFETRSQAQIWRDEDRASIRPEDHPFEVFEPGSVNLGLRLVYRQEWRHLGTQPGEIVRTLPLGPGQTERVTAKVVRRQKRITTLETTTSTETETESSESTKDSSEVVTEAASSFNWNVAAEVSGGIGFVSGSVSTSVGGTSEDRSRETSSSLSEAMRKTASKVRRETKVSVVTESEETLETERFSEIKNPNNESAVTYEFLKLQHQYEVFTRLAELQSVVYVAEEMPARIDEHWVRKHDWVLARVLKDESFRPTLSELTQEVDHEAVLDRDGKTRELLDRAIERFASFEPNTRDQRGGLAIPDIFSAPNAGYQAELRAAEERRRANEIRRIKRERLYQHIRDNILHYCQAIWRSEGSDQRLLRYKKEGRRLPIEWRGPLTIQRIGAPGLDLSAFTPTGREADLWEVIDPTGPIAFVGNYAVFTLRPLPDHYEVSIRHPERRDEIRAVIDQGELLIGVNEILAAMSAPYLGPAGTLLDPAWSFYQRQALQINLQTLRALSDGEVYDFLSYLPRLESVLLDQNGDVLRAAGQLAYQITRAEWGEYLYRKGNTRRFLLDSNNLYLNLRVSGGAALEPFKRAHRYLDVLKTAEQVSGERLKNDRRTALLNSDQAFDPDIQKVVVVSGGASPAAVVAGLDSESPSTSPAPAEGTDEP